MMNRPSVTERGTTPASFSSATPSTGGHGAPAARAGVANDGEPAEVPARPGPGQSRHAVPDEVAVGEDAHVEEPVVDELGPAEEVLSPVEPEREVGDSTPIPL